jgi:uncharacterized membrane protein
MANNGPRRTARRPFYPLLAVFAASCLLGTLATDMVYWWTADIIWADFSDWFVSAGVVVGYLTIVVALIEIFTLRSGRFRRRSWGYAIGLIFALLLATVDMLMHTRDAWTSVVPWGLILSAAIAAVILVTAWMTREMDDPADVEVMG